MNIFFTSTTARAGTVVESSCYFGRNEAVEYRDIVSRKSDTTFVAYMFQGHPETFGVTHR